MQPARSSQPVINVRIFEMLRSFFGSLSRSTWAQRTFSHWGIAKQLASRFIAGESTSEAIQAIRRLNERGIQATLDHLGENTSTLAEANQSVDEVIHILDEIDRSGARAKQHSAWWRAGW